MRTMFELSYVRLKETDGDWGEQPSTLDRVLAAMERVGVLNAVRFVSRQSDKPEWYNFDSTEQLRQRAQRWKPNTYLAVSGLEEVPDVEVVFNMMPKLLEVKLLVADVTSTEQVSALESCLEFVEVLHGELSHKALVGPLIRISPPFNLSLPKTRPPREFDVLRSFSMVDCFCRTYFEKVASEGRKKEVERLLSFEMPDWVERRDEGDLVILRWVDRFDDVEHIRERLTRRLVWLIEHLDPPISSNFNETGDQRANPSVKAESEALTFYDPIPRHGYKATVCPEDKSVDEELFAQLKQWLEAEQTPSGEELRALHLVLPSREAAVRIQKRAEEIGIGQVLYTGEDGNLWDPFPPGDWLDDDGLP